MTATHISILEPTPSPDWQPEKNDFSDDQRVVYDRMRSQCPVAFSEYFQWSVFRHQDVTRILNDHGTFSSRVSQHVSVPNGIDLPDHTAYRRLIEPYFSEEQVALFKPQCQAIAAALVESLEYSAPVEIMSQLAAPFAAQIQCAFMGWSSDIAPVLLDWLKRNSNATRNRDRSRLKEYAAEFENLIQQQLELYKDTNPENNVTARLLQEQINGRTLNTSEISSILRNWTAGEVGTIAASVGIIIHDLATHPELQQQLREKPELLWYANDEIQRLFNPLADNRRRTTCPIKISDREIPADSRLTLSWIAANRDPAVFEHATEFRWGRDERKNLLYGAGLHVCPGAPLAKMELVVVIRMLLQSTKNITLEAHPELARYPSSGYQRVHVRLN